MTFYAQSNLIKLDKNGTKIWDTSAKMPHIIDYGTDNNWYIPPLPITITGTDYTCNSSQNYYLRSSPNFKAANSFVFAYIKIRNNANRTEVDTSNPIFVAGSLCLRIYIENDGYRGALIITPRVWDGYMGFNIEHTYKFNRSSDPPHLFIDASRTNCNPQISIDYTLYYGRFL